MVGEVRKEEGWSEIEGECENVRKDSDGEQTWAWFSAVVRSQFAEGSQEMWFTLAGEKN